MSNRNIEARLDNIERWFGRIERLLGLFIRKEDHDMSDLSDAVKAVSDKVDGLGTQLAKVKTDAEAVIAILQQPNPDTTDAIAKLQTIAGNADTHSQTAATIASELEAAVPAVHAADPDAPAPPAP